MLMLIPLCPPWPLDIDHIDEKITQMACNAAVDLQSEGLVGEQLVRSGNSHRVNTELRGRGIISCLVGVTKGLSLRFSVLGKCQFLVCPIPRITTPPLPWPSE